MEDGIRLCYKCAAEADVYVVTNWYDRVYDERDICISAEKKSERQTVCMACLQGVLEQYESAHHMVWRVNDVYFPDGFNYDRLMKESVEFCAWYRDVTVAEFLWGKPLWARLVGWFRAFIR